MAIRLRTEAGGRRRWSSRRLVGLAVLLALLASVVVAAVAATVDAQNLGESAEAVSRVRIAARKLANGNVEFGLDLSGGDRWLPQARFFAYPTVEVGRWLRSSPYGMSDGNDVRIRARKLANGKVEFALQVGAGRQWLPAQRNFPYRTAALGRWLYASWYTVGDATSPLSTGSSAVTASPTTDGASCTFESAMSTVLPSVFQVVVTTSRGTGLGSAFYVGNNEFITAAHVVEGARTIRLQNHERTLRQVQVVGVDGPSDVAILRAEGAGISAIRFGDESTVGRGARIAAVGYPGNLDYSEGYPASIASGLLSQKAFNTDHDYVFYLRTDAAANPGNSGGPLITACGEVIGLLSWKIAAIEVEGLSWSTSERTIQEVMRRPRRVTGPPTGASGLGAWHSSTFEDDGRRFVASVSEVYEYEDALGNEEAPALVVTCGSGDVEVYVWWDAFVAADFATGRVSVEYRFDDGGWVVEGWYESTSNEAAFARSPRSFVNAALRADEVTIWAWNFGEELLGGAEFELDGLDAALPLLPCY